jgi:hypothetical protein
MAKRNNSTPAKVQTNAGVNPMGSPKAPTISQNLKIAGTGGITKQELKSITKATGKSGGQVIQRLDTINQNLKGKDQAGIRLNSGAANMLIKEAGPAYGGMYGLTQKPTFGTGQIGKALEGMRGTRASGGYQNPQSGSGKVTPGTAPKFMMGGTAIRPGGREVVQGFGKNQFTYTPSQQVQSPNATPGTGPGPLAPTTVDAQPEPILPENLEEEEQLPPGSGMMAGGGLGALGANKLNRSKSRLRQLGIYGRGTGLLGRGLQYGNALNA